MASIYKRPNSPYWWIKYTNEKDDLIRESTGFRIGKGEETQKARQLRDQKSLEESMRGKVKPGEQWHAWVDAFFKLKYTDSETTLRRARDAWRNLSMFLEEMKIDLPRQLTREHCKSYMVWRQKPSKKRRKYRCGHNTAQLELKFLAMVMDEAVNCKYAPFNPCHRLNIKRLRVQRDQKKPALSDEVVALIREKIPLETATYNPVNNADPEPRSTYFNNSFEIAYYHGCRLSETYLDPMRDVVFFTRKDERAARITFNAKGQKEHTVYLHPKLFPLFDALRAQRKHETYPKPKSPSKEWFNFLTRIGVKKEFQKACFHSLRVTAATKFARAGVSKKKAMEYLGHASSTVHDSYVRLEAEDLDECAEAIQ